MKTAASLCTNLVFMGMMNAGEIFEAVTGEAGSATQ